VQFADVTREAGLDAVQSDASCGQRYFIEQVASGATVFDANGDGFPDIYLPAPKPLGVCVGKVQGQFRPRLYINDGKGRFTLKEDAFPASETVYGIAGVAGDYDNDGKIDLYVAGYDRSVLYHNRGDGTFEDVTQKSGIDVRGFGTGGAWIDYDGDGKLDLYALRYCEWSIETDIACPGPGGVRDVCEPETYTPATNILYRNLGNGKFVDVSKQAGLGTERRRSLGVVAADFNRDGKVDLFVANDLGPNYLYINLGGRFEDEAMQQGVAYGLTGKAQANMGIAVGDVDGDGDLDVCITTFTKEPYTLYRNDGTYWTDVSAQTGIAKLSMPFLGFGAMMLDTRNNGRMDMFFANGHVSPFARDATGKDNYKQRNQLLLQQENGQFEDAVSALPPGDVKVHRGACQADFDGDGRLDILVTAENDKPTLLFNRSQETGNWLLLQLTSANGCATPIGTVCTASVGGTRRVRVLFGGGSYGGDSDTRVHFGLGKETVVPTLEIRWPDGRKQTLKDVKANQVLKIRQSG
jgi:hypothetical protein